MPTHASLTGSELHESKGADTASANTVYVANGSGSGVWKKIDSNVIDTASIPNTNEQWLTSSFADISNVEFIYIPIPFKCTIDTITFILANAITLANSVVTLTNIGVGVLGSQTIAFTGSAEGTTFTFTTSANNLIATTGSLKLASDGGATTACRCWVTVKVTRVP